MRWLFGVLLFLGVSSVVVGLMNLRQSELSSARSMVELRIPFKSTFTDKSGESHTVETYRGQYDPDETDVGHVTRHLHEFRLLKDAINAGK